MISLRSVRDTAGDEDGDGIRDEINVFSLSRPRFF